MDKPALQKVFWDQHHARVPDDDPIWLWWSVNEAVAERLEAAAARIETSREHRSEKEFDRLVTRLDARFAHRIVQMNLGIILATFGILVLAIGLTVFVCWWVMAPGPCVVQTDLARGCYVSGVR